MSILLAEPLDLADLARRQRQVWSTGDYSVIASYVHPVSERLCDDADLHAGWRVLDVATGSGNAAIAAARLGCEAVGIDYVPALLDRARQRASAERLEVALAEADAQSLPFEDGEFDAATSVFGVMFAPDQVRAARELVRVVRPGGTIALASWTPKGFIGEMFRVSPRTCHRRRAPRRPSYGEPSPVFARCSPRICTTCSCARDVHVPVPVARALRRRVRRVVRTDGARLRGRRREPGGTRSRPAGARAAAKPARRRRRLDPRHLPGGDRDAQIGPNHRAWPVGPGPVVR
jgi:SAM-dependent methyltransferase